MVAVTVLLPAATAVTVPVGEMVMLGDVEEYVGVRFVTTAPVRSTTRGAGSVSTSPSVIVMEVTG